MSDKSKYNQVANFTYLDTGVNIAIGKKAPKEYFSMAKEQCETGILKIGTISDIDNIANSFLSSNHYEHFFKCSL